MNKILITGAKGQLGTEISKILPNAIYTDADVLDITNANDVKDFVKSNNVDTIINCAAYTAVDRAEDDVELARKINVNGPANLAKTGANLIHISTDYVFDGTAHRPYMPDDITNPISVYGVTKRAGEVAVMENARNAIIIRTAWLYSAHGNNFVKTMRRLGLEKESINVVCDKVGTPTFAGDLASAIVKILPQLNEKNRGIYHFTNAGVCSWYDFATAIMDMSGLKCDVYPIRSEEYPTRAKRPFYSVLDTNKIRKTFDIAPEHWTIGLKKCIGQLNQQNTK